MVWFALLGLFFWSLGLQNATYAQGNAAAGQQLSATAQQIASEINRVRGAAGLAPLTLHPLLNQAAQNHVNDLLGHGLYGHMGSDGSYVRQRVQRVGYPAGGWASENWVAAQDAAGAMNWWLNDWIHRENILNTQWRELGVGAGADPNGGLLFVTVFTAGQNPAGESVTSASAEPQTLNVPAEGINYTIQPGDTLLGIALRYGLDWTMIAETNRLSERSLLQIGQVVRLPGVQTSQQPTTNAAPPPSQSATVTAQPAPAPPPGRTYIVQNGDTLLAIALRFQQDWETVAAANELQENSLLQIGQSLIIPTSAPLPATNTAAVITSPTAYTVAAGDTIISIAQRFDRDWRALLSLNGLAENSTLQIGQVLRLQ